MLGRVYLSTVWVSVYNKQLVVHEWEKNEHRKEKEICQTICENMTGREQNLKAVCVCVHVCESVSQWVSEIIT